MTGQGTGCLNIFFYSLEVFIDFLKRQATVTQQYPSYDAWYFYQPLYILAFSLFFWA